MNIGLDLDEVTADFLAAVLKFYHKKTGKLYTKADFPEWKWWPQLGLTKEEAVRTADEFHEKHDIRDVPPLEHAVKSINYLLKSHKIIVITSRPSRFKAKVEAWIKHHIGAPLEVIHAGDFHKGQAATKAEICNEKGVIVLLEDSPDTSMECAKSGIRVILFDNPWNQKIKHKNITRVKNWLEALEVIEHI